MRRFTKLAAASAAAALTLTACGGGDGGGEAGGPRGFTLSFDGDVDKLNAMSDDPLPDNLRFLFEDTLMRGAFDPEGGFAVAFGPGDGLIAMRAFEDSFYVKFDLPGMAEIDPDSLADFDPAEVRGQLDQFGAFLDDDLIALAGAALDGEWVGVTDIDQEAATALAESFGVEVPDASEASERSEDLKAQLESLLTVQDGTLESDYLVLEGDGPTYSATLRARAFVEFLNELAGDLSAMGAIAGGAPTSIPVEDVPEEIGGFEVTVDGDQVSRISADVALIGESLGEDTEGMAEGDMVLNLEIGEPGDLLSAPSGATTIPFEDLATLIEDFGSMMMPAA